MSFKPVAELAEYVPLARLGIGLAMDIIEAATSSDPVDEAEFLARMEAKGVEFEAVMARVANSRAQLREVIARKKAERDAQEG